MTNLNHPKHSCSFKNMGFIVIGLLVGIIGMLLLSFTSSKDDHNIILKKDYCIENIGKLKKGTILKFDHAMSEGFTRYILYLNIDGGEEVDLYIDAKKRRNLTIPYWLRSDTAICE